MNSNIFAIAIQYLTLQQACELACAHSDVQAEIETEPCPAPVGAVRDTEPDISQTVPSDQVKATILPGKRAA